jgi:hypothetical protein
LNQFQKDRGEVEISINNIIRDITDIKADGMKKKKNTRKRGTPKTKRGTPKTKRGTPNKYGK